MAKLTEEEQAAADAAAAAKTKEETPAWGKAILERLAKLEIGAGTPTITIPIPPKPPKRPEETIVPKESFLSRIW